MNNLIVQEFPAVQLGAHYPALTEPSHRASHTAQPASNGLARPAAAPFIPHESLQVARFFFKSFIWILYERFDWKSSKGTENLASVSSGVVVFHL